VGFGNAGSKKSKASATEGGCNSASAQLGGSTLTPEKRQLILNQLYSLINTTRGSKPHSCGEIDCTQCRETARGWPAKEKGKEYGTEGKEGDLLNGAGTQTLTVPSLTDLVNVGDSKKCKRRMRIVEPGFVRRLWSRESASDSLYENPAEVVAGATREAMAMGGGLDFEVDVPLDGETPRDLSINQAAKNIISDQVNDAKLERLLDSLGGKDPFDSSSQGRPPVRQDSVVNKGTNNYQGRTPPGSFQDVDSDDGVTTGPTRTPPWAKDLTGIGQPVVAGSGRLTIERKRIRCGLGTSVAVLNRTIAMFTIVGASVLGNSTEDAIDRIVMNHMCKYSVPNGSVSIISPDGRLVYARSFTNRSWYGAQDTDIEMEISTPYTLFRIASISKTFTGLAVVQQIQAGNLSLDTKVFSETEWSQQEPWSGAGFTWGDMAETIDSSFPFDPSSLPPRNSERFSQVTIQHLLTHTAGWPETFCRKTNSMAQEENQITIAERLGKDVPIDASDLLLIAMMEWWDQHLDGCSTFGRRTTGAFRRPGTVYNYSPIGFILIGEVLRNIRSTKWATRRTDLESRYRNYIFNPLGMNYTSFGLADSTLPPTSLDGEISYQTNREVTSDSVLVPPAVGQDRPHGPMPYYGWNMAFSAPAGGIVSNAIDMARYLADLQPHGEALVTLEGDEGYRRLLVRSPSSIAATGHTDGGWILRIRNSVSIAATHTGALAGTNAVVAIYNGAGDSNPSMHGLAFSALFNSKDSQEDSHVSLFLTALETGLRGTGTGTTTSTTTWSGPAVTISSSSNDLFPYYV